MAVWAGKIKYHKLVVILILWELFLSLFFYPLFVGSQQYQELKYRLEMVKIDPI